MSLEFRNYKIPAGYEISSVSSYITQKCFNDDDKLEFVVTYRKINSSYQYPDANSIYKMWVVNEDIQLIYDFGEAYSFTFMGFHKNANELRYSVIVSLMNEDNESVSMCDIYRCEGSGTSKVGEMPSENTMPAYPNPSSNTITIPYNLSGNQTSELHIFDMQGHLVKSVKIGPHFHEVNIDVSSFASGTCIYEYNGIPNKIVVR